MAYKFENLEVWRRALDYADRIHEIAEQLPKHERYNLSDQMTRAANSIALNIAEGSTGLSDTEQDRFLRIAIRSLLETVACLHLVKRRDYLDNLEPSATPIATAKFSSPNCRPSALPLRVTLPFRSLRLNIATILPSDPHCSNPAAS